MAVPFENRNFHKELEKMVEKFVIPPEEKQVTEFV